MPFGQMRVVDGEIPPDVEGTVVDGTLVGGIVVEGTVVDCGTVENGDEGLVEGEMLGVEPTTLLPVLALPPMVGVEPTVLPN